MTSDDTETHVERQPFNGSPLADPEERSVIFAVLDSLRQYRKNCHFNITHRRRQNLYALPRNSWSILASEPIDLLTTLNSIDDAIDQNADIADAILNLGLDTFGLPHDPPRGSDQDWHGTAKPNDMAKTHSTIRQFYRDWSANGFDSEIKPMLTLVLSALSEEGLRPASHKRPKLLLPGAGLGRLLFELAIAGYDVEGNEISYHQLLASNFILNTTQRARQYTIYPFATTFTNHLSRREQLTKIHVPDIHPAMVLNERAQQAAEGKAILGEMDMAAGDFVTSYATAESEGAFDAVLTVYFIDTAPNLLRYIETVKHCLKPGGLWINIGPLLWHFDDSRGGTSPDQGLQGGVKITHSEDAGIGEPGSFELTDEEVLLLVKQLGFELVSHELLSDKLGGYIQDPNSMFQNRYRCSHWVVRRR